MRTALNPGSRILRIILYGILIVLINVAGVTLFFRLDLTKGKIYSLAEASKNAVVTLQEPLTIKAFFSRTIPPPYNNTEQQLRDLLEEYALHANQNFNYTISSIQSDEDETEEEARSAILEAQRYGIYPVQVQNIEKDEVKLQNVTMGMAFIHGDLTETIPVLGQTDNLEYRITQMIQRMSGKIGALLALLEDVRVELYLSSNLFELSGAISRLPQLMNDMVTDLNRENYGRLAYLHRDPISQPELAESAKAKGVAELTLRRAQEQGETAESAYAGVVVTYEKGYRTIDLFRRGLFGDLQLEDQEYLSQQIQDSVERLIGLNQKMGYLTGFGALPLRDQGETAGLNNFADSLSDGYDIQEIVAEGGIPEDVTTLVIAGPTEVFSDYALFQIDQFLMKGNSLAVFLDTYREIFDQSTQASGFGQPPRYAPIQTGLEQLLRHYGVEIEPSYVLDQNCYRRVQRLADGSLTEIPFYFYAMIPMEKIARDLPFLQSIKGLIMLNVSPLNLREGSARGTAIVSSTEESWVMREDINLYNPLIIQPPTNPDEKGTRALAYLLEGEFSSYYQNRDLPAPPSSETEDDALGFSRETLSLSESFRRDTRAGKLLVIGSSAILSDAVVDREAGSPNAAFILNSLDYLSGREDYAVMRSKAQRYNPLEEVKGSTRSFVKSFNIAGLPILTGVVGLLVWALWTARKKRIQATFQHRVDRQDTGGVEP